MQAANLSFKSLRGGYDNLKTTEPMKSFKHSPSKLGSATAHHSQDGDHSVMSRMKRSITILGGRAGSEAGMTDRSAKVCTSYTMLIIEIDGKNNCASARKTPQRHE